MTPTILTLRAITGVFLQRLIRTAAIVSAAVGLLLVAGTITLMTRFDPIWGLLLVLIIPLGLFAAITLWTLHLMADRLLPREVTRHERKKIYATTSKLLGVVETARTPLVLLLPMVAKDVVRGRESNVIRTAINDSVSLREDFKRLTEMF